MTDIRDAIMQEAEALPTEAKVELLAKVIRMLAADNRATPEQLRILEQIEERTSMETTIQQFVFEEKDNIRVVQDGDGEVWFVASDVCRALDISNVSDAVSRLDEDEKGDIVSSDAIGRTTSVATINESGLYSLVLSSRKPDAKPFKRWITHEVIPSIRKTGSYSMIKQAGLSPAQALLAAVQHIVEHEQILAEHDHRLLAMEARITAIDEGSQYFTILAYARIRGLKIDNKTAQVYGMQAARWSRSNGYPVGQAPDARFGTVGTYHIDALEAVFGKGNLS